MTYPDPKPAPFQVSQHVRYVGPGSTIRNFQGRFEVRPGDICECYAIREGRRGGDPIGHDDETGEPEYSRTWHHWSLIRFPNGFETHADAESEKWELAEEDK